MNAETLELAKKLDKHPYIKARIEAILHLAENTSGSFDRADDVEEQLIIEVRKMGNEVLQTWATEQEKKKTAEASNNKDLIRHLKKN